MEHNINIFVLLLSITIVSSSYICPIDNDLIIQRTNVYDDSCGKEYNISLIYSYFNKNKIIGNLYHVIYHDAQSAKPLNSWLSRRLQDIPIKSGTDGKYSFDDVTMFVYADSIADVVENTIDNIYTNANGYLFIKEMIKDNYIENTYYNNEYYFEYLDYLNVSISLNATLIDDSTKYYIKLNFDNMYKIFEVKIDMNNITNEYIRFDNNTITEKILITDYNNFTNTTTRQKRQINLYDLYDINYTYNKQNFINYAHMTWYIYDKKLTNVCNIIKKYNREYNDLCDLNPSICLRLNSNNTQFNIKSYFNNTFIINICYNVTIKKYYFEESMCTINIKVLYNDNYIGYYNTHTGEIFANNINSKCKDYIYLTINNELYYVSKHNNFTLEKVNESNIIKAVLNPKYNYIPYIYTYNNSITIRSYDKHIVMLTNLGHIHIDENVPSEEDHVSYKYILDTLSHIQDITVNTGGAIINKINDGISFLYYKMFEWNTLIKIVICVSVGIIILICAIKFYNFIK